MWKWSGPLVYKSGESPLCRVTMHVPPNTPQGIGLRFSIIFQGVEKIEVNSMYDCSDIRSILPAFRKPPQHALFGPEGVEDVPKFRAMVHYMERQQMVFMMPIHFDDNIIGYTVFFPYSLGLRLLGTPPPSGYSEPGTLVVAILPYALSQEQIKLVPRIPKIQLHSTSQQGPRTRTLVKYPRLHHRATKILGFPDVLRKFLSDPVHVRTFSIWPDPDSRMSAIKDRQSLETRLLLNILEFGQRSASSKSDVRVAFIHIGSLQQIHKFPEFAERRTKTFLQFYTYGTHYDVPPDMWAVKEIYPCGGIITFTPAAMHRDPVKVRQLIIQVGRHPLWECYILPASLGLLAQIECGTDDPLLRLERKQLMMEGILQSIEDGEVALMQAPPEKPIVTQQKDERAIWASQYVSFFPPTKKQALQAGIMAFVQNPGLGRSKDMIEKVIVKDLSMMQRHPAFMTSYRRFVVINLEAEGSRCGEYHEGFEWTSASKFDFRDDFYPKQTIGMH
ncbi:hypothetical protein M413DRAFT_217736 [Hebeloma cylindrosporum]|uniref:Uncharacterized protein n=1 Tax=Hebeloma cylindrosporum TaxID=76867 RepID=A0A0C3CVW8_HEBCY|nr:hypothetical protein M413DRAFT_217736 [Hebeloma cylindrosporum h7]